MVWLGTGETLGHMADDGVREPYGDTPGVDELLAHGSVGADRRERFAYYARGYSNGAWATEPIDT